MKRLLARLAVRSFWFVIFLDLGAGVGWADSAVERVSIGTKGLETFSVANQPGISADGRFVAFASDEETMAPPDGNGFTDVFVRDRLTGQTERVSVGTFVDGLKGREPDGDSYAPSISADGRFVAFVSEANSADGGLIPGVTSPFAQIYVFDRKHRKTVLVSARPDGKAGDGFCSAPSISGDGRSVAFLSFSSDLVRGDTNGGQDVFVRDLASHKTARVSVKTGGAGTAFASPGQSVPRMSFDGRFVVFSSRAADLVAGDANGTNADVFLHDRRTRTTTLASVVSNALSLRQAFQPDISADGRFVAYADFAAGFSDFDQAGLDGNGTARLFDRITGQSVVIAAAGSAPRPSADGRTVAYVQRQAPAGVLVKVLHRPTGRVVLATPEAAAFTGNQQHEPALSADGRVIALTTPDSYATGDNNFGDDVYAAPLFDTLSFEAAVVPVNENAGSVQVRVRRRGRSLGALAVSRAVSMPGDTADPGVDYNFPGGTATGTLSWADGDDSVRTLTIPLLNRPATADGYRTLAVAISSPTGGAALGIARATVVIRDQANPPLEDRAGHGLKIVRVVERGTRWGARLFRGEFTIRNPSALPSFAGRFRFKYQALDGITRRPSGDLHDLLEIDTQLPIEVAVPAIPARGEIALVVPASLDNEFDGQNLDGILFAYLFETTPLAGDVLQDTAKAATFDTANGVLPPAGGATQPNSGVDAPGFNPIRIASVTVAGAAQVNETSTGNSFTATVRLNDGSTLTNVTPRWGTSAFAIAAGGVLTTGEVTRDSRITLTATVTRQGQTVSGSRAVTVKNVPAVPVITSGLSGFASTEKPYSYRIVAVHEPAEFEANGLPEGLSVGARTGLITGTATLPDGTDVQTFPVQIRARNGLGTDTETLVLLVSRPSPLTVSLAGAGTGAVIGIGKPNDAFPRVENRDVGRTFTLLARPGVDSLFDGWDGDLVSPQAKFTFTMTPALELTARFVPNIYTTLEKAGIYSGFVVGTPAAHGSTGLLSVTVGTKGALTGKLMLGGQTHRIKGVLAANGTTAPLIIGRRGVSPLTLTLVLNVAPGSDVLTATVSDGIFNAATTARRVVNTAGALAGRYTVLLPTGTDSAELPQGTGSGSLTVSARGAIRLAGALGDSRPLAIGGALTAGNFWPLYTPLYRGGGSLGGLVTFANLAATDLAGTLSWFKPAQPGDAVYPDGWPDGLATTLRGSSYAQPPVFPGLDAPGVGGNALFTAHGGGLPGDQAQIFDLDTTGRVTLVAPVLSGLSLSFNAGSGLYGGRFFDAMAGATRGFRGAVLQKSGEAQGTFPGTAKRTGSATVTPFP